MYNLKYYLEVILYNCVYINDLLSLKPYINMIAASKEERIEPYMVISENVI